jgi:8-oxo-dGTP pyrophosphatase MutT (NUDIX family)
VKEQVSAGGVIFRREGGEVEVALTGRQDEKNWIWALAKGLLEEGEEPDTAALREVREETGLEGRILQKLGVINYWFYSRYDRARIHKTVHFYLMECVSGETEDHDFEVDEVRWFPLAEAKERLAYEGEKEIMAKSEAALAEMT